MTFCYFAYGSNMLTKRLKRRCPGASSRGRANADGYVLQFSKPSNDGSGKATLRGTAGSRTVGVLFEIPSTELRCLDHHEGVGFGYERCDTFPVRSADTNELVQTVTYIATSPDTSLQPYDWYLALVVAGAQEHALGDNYIRALQHEDYIPDPDEGRETRDQAIKALMDAGHTDYRRLLAPE